MQFTVSGEVPLERTVSSSLDLVAGEGEAWAAG